jgi:hypothetical protein
MGLEVFVSYKRENADATHRLSGVFADLGIDVWYDVGGLRPNDDWADVLLEKVREAQVVVVCWSEQAKNSDWVLREAGEGFRRGVLVQVRLDDCEPPPNFTYKYIVDLRGRGWYHCARRVYETRSAPRRCAEAEEEIGSHGGS